MTRISSENTPVAHTEAKLFNFLTDLNNFGRLMPPEVSDWQGSTEECSFSIKGMPKIGFRIADKTPFQRIQYTGTGKLPAAVNLLVDIQKSDERNSMVMLSLEADLNPMLKMMFEKPLGKFLNALVQNLGRLQIPD